MDEIYEALASVALRAHGKSKSSLNRALTHFVMQKDAAPTPACAAGFDYVIKRLREKLRDMP